MPAKGIAAPSDRRSYTWDDDLYSNGITTPTGRRMASGSVACLITGLEGYASGRGGSVSMRLVLGSSATSYFTVGSSSEAQYTGRRDASHWLVAGGGAQFRYEWNGATALYFGRGGSGHTYSAVGGGWPGDLAGAMYYAQSPSAPGTPSVNPSDDGESAVVSFGAPSDDGDIGITNYRLQRALNSSFTSGVATVNSDGNTLVTNLEPGEQYYWRACAQNAVTNSANSIGGPWSGTRSAIQPDNGLGRIRNAADTDWIELAGFIRNPADTDWVEMEGRIRNATDTGWIELGS